VRRLAGLAKLKTVYFESNPITKADQYRVTIRRILPQVTQIDATLVRNDPPLLP
jgi:hypothetical protein